MQIKKTSIFFGAILFMAVLLRLVIIYTKCEGITSDNAIIGLMGKHILKGEFPVFFYGQTYMGSLEAYIAAFFFFIIGVSAKSLSVAVGFVSILGIVSVYFLAREVAITKKDRNILGLYAMLAASLPPDYIFWHGLSALGGYPETFFFGNVLLLIALKILKTENEIKKLRYYVVFGFISGLAFWTHMLVVCYIAASLLFLLINENKKFIFFRVPLFVIPAFIFGSLPLWIYNIQNNFDTFKLPTSSNIFEGLKYFCCTVPRLLLGSNPLWLFIIVLMIYGIAFLFLIKNSKKQFFKNPRSVFFFLFLFVAYFFCVNGTAFLCCARYLFPLFTVIVVSLAWFTNYCVNKNKYMGFIPLIFVLLFNSTDIYKSYIDDKKETCKEEKIFGELIDFLDKNNLNTNYCPYWVSQKLNFLSDEKIINSDPEGERYLPYEEAVATSDRIAFIEEDTKLEISFNMLCESYARQTIGPYSIYYDFVTKKDYGRLVPIDKWRAVSNYNQEYSSFAFDRDVNTYWNSGVHKKKGMYFQLDMGCQYKIYKFSLHNYFHWNNYPSKIKVKVSMDGQKWDTLKVPEYVFPVFLSSQVLCWHRDDGRFELLFSPVDCRYIRIEQEEEDAINPWEINELFVWEYLGERKREFLELEDIYKYLSEKNIKILYADFWLSSKIYMMSNKMIVALRPFNQNYPYRNNASMLMSPDEGICFIVDKENVREFENIMPLLNADIERKEFENYVCFYVKKVRCSPEMFFWSGYGLLKTNFIDAFYECKIKWNKMKIGFDGGFVFLGYNIVQKGNDVFIDYFWKIKRMPKDTFVFVHFVQRDKIIFQNDHVLLEQLPLFHKIPDNVILKETCRITNPPKGDYDIVIGLYKHGKTDRRIKIKYPKGNKSKIDIGKVTI
jgi:hypothetical protein